MVAKRKRAAGAMPRTRRTATEIKRRLMAAAHEEFRRSGFIGATTAAIARRAGITEAQLFRYYGSKAELFRESVFEPLNRHFAEFNAKHMPALDRGEPIREQARLYIRELCRFLDEHSKSLLVLMVAQTFASGDLQSVGEIESLRVYFDKGAAAMKSRVAKHPKVDPRLLVRVSFAAVLGCVLFRDWLFPSGTARDSKVNEAIMGFVIDGISINADAGLRESA